MIRSVPFIFTALLMCGCTFIHQDQPNTPPYVKTSRVVCISPEGIRDTLSVNTQCSLNRGGEMELYVFANDQDDDPLAYHWTSYGSGTFRDSTAAQTSWFAPNSTDNDFTQYSLTLTIKDRDCQAINSVTERRACQEEDVKEQLSFLVNVTQRPPKVYAPSDTTISLQESSSAYLEAWAQDPDGDVLSYKWILIDSITDTEEILPSDSLIDEDTGRVVGSRVIFENPIQGVVKVGLLVSDGQSDVEKKIQVKFIDSDPL